MLRMSREAPRFFSTNFLPRLCRRGIFLFSRVPCRGGSSISPQKLLPVRPVAEEIFFAALFRRLIRPWELKQKKEGNPERIFLPSKRILQAQALNDERLLFRSLSKDNLGIGLLSHVKVRSIMGDEALNFRVRNGIGCTRFSMDTKEIFQNI